MVRWNFLCVLSSIGTIPPQQVRHRQLLTQTVVIPQRTYLRLQIQRSSWSTKAERSHPFPATPSQDMEAWCIVNEFLRSSKQMSTVSILLFPGSSCSRFTLGPLVVSSRSKSAFLPWATLCCIDIDHACTCDLVWELVEFALTCCRLGLECWNSSVSQKSSCSRNPALRYWYKTVTSLE